MLKSISNLGVVLSKAEQQKINGGQARCRSNEMMRCVYQNYEMQCVCVKITDPEIDS